MPTACVPAEGCSPGATDDATGLLVEGHDLARSAARSRSERTAIRLWLRCATTAYRRLSATQPADGEEAAVLATHCTDQFLQLALQHSSRGWSEGPMRIGDVDVTLEFRKLSPYLNGPLALQGNRVSPRAIVLQKKRQRPVQFEVTEQTRDAVAAWIAAAHQKSDHFLFPSRVSVSPHLSTRQYSRIVRSWVAAIGMDPAAYGTHSLRRTKATLIYRRTKNLRAVQLLLGHTKLESTVRYLGIEVDDALEIAEQTEV